MSKWQVILTITGSAARPEIEAEDEIAAIKQAEDEWLDRRVSVCHSCSNKVEELTVTAVSVSFVREWGPEE